MSGGLDYLKTYRHGIVALKMFRTYLRDRYGLRSGELKEAVEEKFHQTSTNMVQVVESRVE